VPPARPPSALQPTISISLLDHVLFRQNPDYQHRFQLLETRRHFSLGNDLDLHILELPKFQKSVTELTSTRDKWPYFLRHAEMMDPDALPEVFQAPIFTRAFQELDMLSHTELERERYEARRKSQLDHNSFMNAARREGLQEGEQRGEERVRRDGFIRLVQMCERLLKRPITPHEELSTLPTEQLALLAQRLDQETLGSE
jgi:predicted transposase/invertase (TIGR01784 family)